MNNEISKTKLYVWIGVILAITVGGLVSAKIGKKNIDVVNKLTTAQINQTSTPKPVLSISSISGIACADAKSRPIAVMMSSDKEARPLSGIGEADLVFEMPVVENGFTRMMAVYQCGRPKELGSIRSSRLDFVPLALGLNAIYAHFGGEHTVLEELNNGIIDNIDGLKYDGTTYYRKKSIPRPHNAFTNFALLGKTIGDLGYETNNNDIGYPHETKNKSLGQIEPASIYEGKFQVNWKYNQKNNAYPRYRSGKAEIDKNTKQQAEVKNVVLMKTNWSPISKDYIRVKTVGSGEAMIYKNGQAISSTWEKKDDKSKLYFYDANHKEITFVAGKIWIEIDARIQE